MNRLICVVLCCSYVAWCPFIHAKDGIEATNTNQVALCTSKSDLVANIRVKSIDLVQKPTDPNVADLSVYGRLITLQIKKVYMWRDNNTNFPANVYLYRRGAVGRSFLDPTLKVGQECIAFLRHTNAPDILNADVVTNPKLPDDDYFSFAVLPQRMFPGKKAYIPEPGTNTTVMLETFFANSNRVMRATRRNATK